MKKQFELVLLPEEAADEHIQKQKAASHLHISPDKISFIKLLKRSIDARTKQVKIRLFVEIYYNEPPPKTEILKIEYPNISNKTSVIIVGSGPSGLFAALRLIELGVKPIIFERGKDVQSRRRDLAAINKEHIVNPDSNYCFGEGGAGTYSDGKLYTRSTKRGDINKILNVLVAHGAKDDILIDAHPHIGTNKLPKIVTAMRETILNAGGEVHFNTRVEDFIIKDHTIKGVITHKGEKFEAASVILATGHSARDIFELLHRKNILLEAKPFALGIRIEHPQRIIDSIQYHCDVRSEYLPAASYSLAQQIDNRGVYSFCMCPGGFIVPAATAPAEIVVNGMSPSKRDSKFANSGIVVAIDLEDIKDYQKYSSLSALKFQQDIEKAAWEAGGKTQTAPAQRMIDFVKGKLSSTLPETSYQPGIKSALLNKLFPKFISYRLQQGLEIFGKKMKGYYTNEAVLLGIESRTSSPVRIPRDPNTLQHLQIKNLYPCGEGAGYAGGIVSAAMDGERCAEQCAKALTNT